MLVFHQKESVPLAIQLLDDMELRGGRRISVQEAKFELKGSYDPSKKPKMLSKKEKKKFKKDQEKLVLRWRFHAWLQHLKFALRTCYFIASSVACFVGKASLN